MDAEQHTSVTFAYDIPEYFHWFPESRYGVFIHWGPYSVLGRGEQVLFREHLDPTEYEKAACCWNPSHFNAKEWASIFKKAGFRYACLTTRHHDGYCLWDTKTTNYSSMRQAPKRDFVREFCDAMGEAGIKVGLYYSWCDWRIPAYYEGPKNNPSGWEAMKNYIHSQVEELCTKYGEISYFFFDGVWPRNAQELGSQMLLEKMRQWQPHILINNRLGFNTDPGQLLKHGGGNEEGDFGTPERLITAENRLWESCQVSYWRWWGYHAGEHWKSTEEILDTLCSCVSSGGNLILNVGPSADGQLPEPFCTSVLAIGRWLEVNGEAIFKTDGGNLTEALTYGYQTLKENQLYLILRFWDKKPVFRLADLTSEVLSAELLSSKKPLDFTKQGDDLLIQLPSDLGQEFLFPVIKITCKDRPSTNDWGSQRNWEGDPLRVAKWGKQRWEQWGFQSQEGSV